MCIGCTSLCHMEGGLYICLLSESNGPNLLDEPSKRLHSVPCLLTLVVFWGLANPGHMGYMTHSESVQPLQSVKLL
jgi:hypothetical protein